MMTWRPWLSVTTSEGFRTTWMWPPMMTSTPSTPGIQYIPTPLPRSSTLCQGLSLRVTKRWATLSFTARA